MATSSMNGHSVAVAAASVSDQNNSAAASLFADSLPGSQRRISGSLYDEEEDDLDDEEHHLNQSLSSLSSRNCHYRPLLNEGEETRRQAGRNKDRHRRKPTILTQTHFDARYRFTRPKTSSLSLRQLLSGTGFGGAGNDGHCSKRCLLDCLLSLFPFISVIRQYQWRSDLIADTIAGLTVGIMNIPQGMAYAMLADLPPVCGLYLGFFPLILYFFFGTSRQVSMGTFALSSLMVAVPVVRIVGVQLTPALADILGPLPTMSISTEAPVAIINNATTSLPVPHGNYTEDGLNQYRIQVALSVTLLAGLIQIGLGLFRFGFITIYLSTPLVSGFTTGAAFHVMTSQVPAIFGIKVPRHASSFKLIHSYMDIIDRLPDSNPASVIISIVCICLLLLFRLIINAKLSKLCRFPVPIELILVVLGTSIGHFGHLHTAYAVDIVGEIPSGLRAPSMPSIGLFHLVWQDAFMLAIIMYVCTFSICKIYANKHGYLLDSNQELLASGIVNTVGPVFGCYFSAGSLSRSQVQEDMGGRTQVASLIAASLMIFVLLFLGPLFRELPTAVLACIIIVALKGLFMQFRDAVKLYRISKYDFSIWIVCFFGVVILNVSYGLMLGFAYSLLTVVCRTQSPSTSILGRLPTTDIYKDVRFYPSAAQVPGVVVFRFDGALYFASVDNFRYRLVKLTGFDPKLAEAQQIEQEAQHRQQQLELSPQSLAADDEAGSNSAAPSDTASSSSHQTNQSTRLHHIVVECSGINYIDSVGASFLRVLIADYQRVGVSILFACCKHQFRRMLERSEFADKYSVYVSVHDAVLSALADYPNQRARLASDARSGSSTVDTEDTAAVFESQRLLQQTGESRDTSSRAGLNV
uniref:STAS domain-containing protein n=1 Tax=Macrostomum lignano TaxID=282301 RepID=A0A1I8HRN2_9PLAT